MTTDYAWYLDLPADEAANEIIARAAANGMIVTSRSTGAITGYYIVDRKPSIPFTIILTVLLCGIGILYYILSRRQEQQAWSILLKDESDVTNVTVEGQNEAVLVLCSILDTLEGSYEILAAPKSDSELWDQLASLNPDGERTARELTALLNEAHVNADELTEETIEALSETAWWLQDSEKDEDRRAAFQVIEDLLG